MRNIHVVGGVGDRVGDLTNNTLLRLIDVRGRHFEVFWFEVVRFM